MREKRQSAMADGLSRDFAYDEPTSRSPAWQILRDISETIVLTLLMFLVIRLVVQDFQVDGTSMVPTFQDRQFVLVDKLTYQLRAPQRGDVIVFMPPTESKDPYIKRIIGIPGDHVVVDLAGYVSVNGTALNERYVSMISNVEYGVPFNVIVEPNHFFVMGDNRPASSDSRYFGTIAKSVIIGKATLVYWPLSDFHTLADDHAVFAHVPSSQIAPTTSGLRQMLPDTQPSSTLEIFILLPGLAATLRFRRGSRP